MKNRNSKYFSHTQQYYRFVILKTINESGPIEMPIDIDDPALIDAISNAHIHNLLNDGFLDSTNGELKLTAKGEASLHRHYIDYQIDLLNLSKNLGDFYFEKVNRLVKKVKGKAALYGASDTSRSIFAYIQNAGIELECVIDDDLKKQRNDYLGLPVISIDVLDQYLVETVIISTIEFQDKIKEKMVEKFDDKYKIITLFD